MSNPELSLFENYILADNKEAVLSKLIKGTTNYNYLTLLKSLEKNGYKNMSKEEKNLTY